MDARNAKRKRLPEDTLAPASPFRPQKRQRKQDGPVPSFVIDQAHFGTNSTSCPRPCLLINDTQSAFGGDPRSGMDDSDVQEESIQEIAMLQQRNQQLMNQNKLLKDMMQISLRRVIELEARLNRIEHAIRDQGQQGPIAELPYEMIYVIFGFLPLGDLLSCEMVCKNWGLSLVEWLRVLDLSHYYNAVNNLVIQNISKYHKLESLCLARCKDVTDPALSMIVKAFPNLRDLDIFGCQVTDLGQLHSLGKLEYLRVGDSLGIDDNHLKQLPPQIRYLKIEWLLGVQNEGLANIAHLKNLVSLTIEQNDNMKHHSMILPETLVPTLKRFIVIRQGFFNDICLEAMSRFTNLEKLSLYWVPIAGHGFNAMKDRMPNLKKLSLKRCHIFANAGLDALTRSLSHLKKLEIKGITSIDREGFRMLSRMNHLKDLRLRLGRQIIDENEISDLEFLANMRLHRLELIDAIGLTGVGIKKIVDTQEFTLEHLCLSDCHLLHSIDMLPLKRLKRLTYFNVHHATHLASNEENFTFRLLPSGGIDFDVDYQVMEDPEEHDNDGDSSMETYNPPSNIPLDYSPPRLPSFRAGALGPLFDAAGRLQAEIPGLLNAPTLFPPIDNDDVNRDRVLINLDGNDAPENDAQANNEGQGEDDPAPHPAFSRLRRRGPPPRRR